MSDQVSFREIQKFRQPWLWAVQAASVLFMFGIMALATMDAVKASGGSGISTDMIWGWVLVVVFGLGISLLLYMANLTTEVREDGIYVRFFPFHRTYRRQTFESLKSYEVRTYDPIGEYGGWGIRGFGSNMAYNMSGNRGVQLVFNDGRRLLIGSQKPEDLCTAIDTAKRMV